MTSTERLLIAAGAFAGGFLGMYLVGRAALASPSILDPKGTRP